MHAARRFFLFCALFAVFTGIAAAQTGITCTAFVANQPTLRQEGAAEAAGDILISCSGTLIGAQTGPQTLSLYVSGAAITSRQLYTGTTPSSIPTEAALLVNDCTTNSGTSSSGGNCSPSGTFTGGNPTQGFLQNGALVFSGFTLPTTGIPFQIRVTNVRVNANALATGSFVTGTVLATFGISNQQNLVMGAVQASLSVSVSQPIGTNQQCGQQVAGAANLTIKEMVTTAFKSPAAGTLNSTPGQWYQNSVNNESQTVLNSAPGWTNQLSGVIPGQADSGTRIRVNVSNIPPGVTVSMPANITATGGIGSLVATNNGDIGPFSAASGTIVITNFGTATYEVRAQQPSAIDSFTIPLTISSNSSTGAGTLLVSATYAPTTFESGVVTPRFADTSVLSPAFNFLSCLPATHLAFVAQPANGIVGSVLPSIQVQALDVFGNVTATNPTITVTSSPAGVTATSNSTAGLATFSGLVFSSPGTYTLTASASGLASVTSHSFIIRGPTTVTLFPSPGNARYGQIQTLTASVSPLAAAGTVTFYDGTAILGTATLSNGQAQITTTLLPSGTRTLQARYNGNATYSTSISSPIPISINAVAANTLQTAANYAAGSGPSAVAVGDLNRDGIADLVIADLPSSNLAVLLGNADGTFRPAAFYATGNQPIAVVIGDFNGDGKPDIAAANNADGTVSVLMGKGDGTFQNATAFSVGTSPRALAIADFNNDGIPDLAVANFTSGSGGVGNNTNVQVLPGNGDGTFQIGASYSYAAGDSPTSIAVGDFNGDGNPDIAVANLYSNDVSVFLGNGDGSLQSATSYTVGVGSSVGPASIVAADLNADGVIDLAVANLYGNSVSVLIGNGNGTFKTAVSYGAGTGPYSVVVGDFNGDGKVDLACADVSSNAVSVLLGNGNGTFQTAAIYSAGNSPEALGVGDFNGDGRTDIAIANYSDSRVGIMLGASVSAFSISGRVTLSGVGLSGVSITLSGPTSGSTTTDGSGNYSFNGLLPGGSYTVTPALTNFTFTPQSQVFGNLSSNQTVNFAAAPPAGYVIVSGQVTFFGIGLSGVTISANGSLTNAAVTDSSGNYALALTKNTTFTMSASLTGYRFSAPVVFTNLVANQTANFTVLATPTVVSRAVFRDSHGAIQMTTYPSATLSYAGGVFASDPSSAEDVAGNLFVTARDNSNSIWVSIYSTAMSTWTNWAPGGGIIQGVPAIAVDPGGKSWIASRDTYNSYWLVSYAGASGFGSWIPLLGIFSTDPVISACGDGSLYLIGKDTFNSLWSGQYIPGTGFQGWKFGGGIIKGKPAVTCGTDNAVYIAAEDNFNSNWIARVSGNSWTGWYYGGAITSVTPRIVSLANGFEAVVILDSTNVVWRTTFAEGAGNGWLPWVSVGGVLQDVAPAAVNGQLYLAGKAPNGDLWWWVQPGSQWSWIGNNGVAAGLLSAAPR